MARITRNMGLARQTVRMLVNELERSGIVRFALNPHHQRAKLVLLTERGQALYEAAAQRQGPWAKVLADSLPADDVQRTTALMRTLRQRLEAGDDR